MKAASLFVVAAGMAVVLVSAAAPVPPADPRVASAVSRGVSFYQKGDIFAARTEFQAALKLDPAEKKALAYMEKIDRRLLAIARDLLKAGRMSRAAADREMKRILARVPDDAESTRLVFKALERVAEKDEAAYDDLEWILTRPGPEGPSVEAKIESRLKQERAKKAYQKGMAHFQRREWSDAMGAFEEVLAASPGSPEAIQMFEKTRKQVAKDTTQKVDGLYGNAASLYAKGRYDEAAELLREILLIHPLHIDAQRYLEKIESLKEREQAR